VPSYEPFRALPEHFGASMLLLERRLENGWRFDPAEARRILATSSRASGPAHIFFANLHNPTGAFTPADELAELASIAAREGGVLIACEVYMEYVPEALRVHAFRVAPNTVSIGSFTKAYGLGALRMGWIVLGEGIAGEARALRDMTYLAYVDPPTMAIQAARMALERIDELARPVVANRKHVRPAFEHWLATSDAIESTIPSHGIIAFPRVKGVRDTHALCEHLVREHEVDVVPGEFFGLAGHVRVGCGVSPEHLADGLARIERGIASFRKRA
jgi:aspartate/methionine/tyrosine aminotransferase